MNDTNNSDEKATRQGAGSASPHTARFRRRTRRGDACGRAGRLSADEPSDMDIVCIRG